MSLLRHVALDRVPPAVSRGSFRTVRHGALGGASLQFPATPLRLVVFLQHLRTRFWVLNSGLDIVPPAVSRGSFNIPRIQLRIPVDIGNIWTKRIGLPFVQAC